MIRKAETRKRIAKSPYRLSIRCWFNSVNDLSAKIGAAYSATIERKRGYPGSKEISREYYRGVLVMVADHFPNYVVKFKPVKKVDEPTDKEIESIKDKELKKHLKHYWNIGKPKKKKKKGR